MACVETPALTRRVSTIFGRHHSQPTITHSYGIANIHQMPCLENMDFGTPAAQTIRQFQRDF